MVSPHQRRHHKSSSTQQKRFSDSSVTSTDAVLVSTSSSSSRIGGGLWSYFTRIRRRWGRSHRENDTLLPTTYASGTSSPSKRASFNPTAKNCNSFLMGGHYYPGKDKKRRHMRRRTLWYRLFCSSNPRKTASSLVVAYILFWHVLVPVGDLLLQMGSSLSGHGAGRNINDLATWLLHDSTLVIPDLTEEQKISVELAAARARLQYGSPKRNAERLSILGNIVPTWFHRNNQHTAEKAERSMGNAKHQELSKTEKKEVSAKLDRNQILNKKESATISRGDDGKQDKKASTLTANRGVRQIAGQDLPIRTLHNSDEMIRQRPNCPVLSEENFSTTLVVQTSPSRLWILNETCSRWTDPIVAVVFVPKGGDFKSEKMNFSCPNVETILYMATEEESKPANYPVNRLRNVGLDAVRTSHLMVADIDFVPSVGIAENIRASLILRHRNHSEDENEQVLVVPAFERLPDTPCETEASCAAFLQKNSSFVPKSLEDLQHCVSDKKCIVFQSQVNWEGHFSTNSEHWLRRKWYKDREETTFVSIPCFHTARYEPYVVVPWCKTSTPSNPSMALVPYYDERFHGYGKNKIEFISHLRKSGFRFAILPEVFIVHNPHPESVVKQKWIDVDGSDLHRTMDKLYTKFLKELDTKYKDIHDKTIKLCKRE